jgi:predicted ATPase
MPRNPVSLMLEVIWALAEMAPQTPDVILMVVLASRLALSQSLTDDEEADVRAAIERVKAATASRPRPAPPDDEPDDPPYAA